MLLEKEKMGRNSELQVSGYQNKIPLWAVSLRHTLFYI